MKINHYPISDIERERFSEQIKEELSFVEEIKEELGSAELREKKFYNARAKAIRLEKNLKKKMRELEVDKKLQMMSLNLEDLKGLETKLKKRLVCPLNSSQGKAELKALQTRLKDEILQEEHDLKPGFKNFPISLKDIKLINDINK